MTVDMSTILISPQASFGESIQRPPYGPIQGDDVKRHQRDAEYQPRIVTAIGCLGDVCTQSVCAWMLVSPARHCSDNARIPRSAGGGDRPRDVVWKDTGQHYIL